MVCLMSATVILCSGALMRTLGRPLSAITEISLCLFAWCIFLGADTAYRKSSLVYVEIIIDRLPNIPRRIFYAVIYVLIAVFLGVFLFQSIKMVQHSWVRTWASLPKISYGWIALCMPVGCGLMLITTCIHFYSVVIMGRLPKKESEAYIQSEGETVAPFNPFETSENEK